MSVSESRRRHKAYTFITRDEAQDFARILNLTKALIRPLRQEDEKRVANNKTEHLDRESGYRRYGSKRRITERAEMEKISLNPASSGCIICQWRAS